MAVLAVLIGLTQTGDRFPLLERTGLAQLLRQSAWQHALSGQTDQAWPWEDTTFVPGAKVPRLGLSAEILMGDGARGDISQRPLPGAQLGKSDKDLRDVAIGDIITVTAADGSANVYRVTGRRVVDPHLEETDTGLSDAEVSLVTCWPLDPCVAGSQHLVIQATPDELPSTPAPGEQKL
ncbi:MAG: sortase domain-bontaining protein [Methyloceanibacter sp.]